MFYLEDALLGETNQRIPFADALLGKPTKGHQTNALPADLFRTVRKTSGGAFVGWLAAYLALSAGRKVPTAGPVIPARRMHCVYTWVYT